MIPVIRWLTILSVNNFAIIMKTPQLKRDFNFDAFMKARGRSTLVSIAIWMLLFLVAVYKKFVLPGV